MADDDQNLKNIRMQAREELKAQGPRKDAFRLLAYALIFLGINAAILIVFVSRTEGYGELKEFMAWLWRCMGARCP